MPVALPLTPSEPNYRVGTTLSDNVYLLNVRWNAREECWYLDVLTEAEIMIRAGIKVTLGVLLGARVTDTAFPPGVFIAVDQSNSGVDPGFDELGDRVQIYYYDFQEFVS